MRSTHTYELASRSDVSFTVPTDLLIGSSWVQPQDSRRFDVVNPSNGQIITSVADSTPVEAIRAVDAAQDAARTWADTAPRERARLLHACFDTLMAHSETLANLISLESGKSLADAKGEVAYAAEFFRWYAEEAVRINGELNVSPSGANNILVRYQPIGISLLITPWNLPAAMVTRKVAPAIAAGCTCVLKPAEETPLTALAIAKLMLEAGIPPGVLNVVNTRSPAELVRATLQDSRVRKLSFTGSTEVGRILLREAAGSIISSSMELGGNAPFIVFDDADLDEAIAGALAAKIRHSGEACIAANRFYVQRGIYDAFSQRLLQKLETVKVGDGCAPDTECGAMINPDAVSRIERLVADAKTKGARVLLGGAPLNRPGFFYPPTLILDVAPGSDILNEEIFGPVAVITPFDDVEEVIKVANSTPFGLASYVYTSDLKKGLQVSDRLESGMVGLNRGVISDPAAPFGGMKQSGIGREGSHHGLKEFTEAKYIAVSW
jgi:succinate-semialdehyde dehydrogenase / glutarate-semialdehyde dehydrogenase